MQRNQPMNRAIDAATLRHVPLSGVTPQDIVEPYRRPLLRLPKGKPRG